MDESDLNAIWARDILPSIKEHSASTTKPITVTMGGALPYPLSLPRDA